MRHLLDHAPYDTLILGNSRPLPLRAADLGLSETDLFNAALTGESFPTSVLLLEQLAAAGKLPRLALVAFDHAELNYFSVPQGAPWRVRWAQAGRDIWFGLTTPEASSADLASIVARYFISEARILTRQFNGHRVVRGAMALWGRISGGDERLAPHGQTGIGYHADGSRTAPITRTPPLTPLPVPNRNVIPAFLDNSVARLAALRAQGTRVVVFETLLHPALHTQAMARPSGVAAETRKELLASCARHGLECHAAPPTFPDSGSPWADATHPPPAVLASWIASFLDLSQRGVQP